MADTTETTDTSQEQEQSNGAPWDADLAAVFEDEEQRQAVGEFLASKVQPYVTQLEQNSRPNRDATRLWEGFAEEPVNTYIQVSRELYGDDVADKVAAILQGGSPQEQTEPSDTQTTTEEGDVTPPETEAKGISFDDLPVEVREAISRQQAEEQRKAYYAEIERVTAEHADDLPKDEAGKPKLNVDLFHPFVVASDGDFDRAFEAYNEFYDTAKKEFGIQVPDSEQVDTPPTTIDSQTRDASATPPQKVEYESLDQAIDAFIDEQNAPPPTVGAA
jgi:hypothetical protein